MQVGPLEGDKPPLTNPEYLLVILILQIWSMQEPLHMVHTLFQHNTSNLEKQGEPGMLFRDPGVRGGGHAPRP